MQTSRGELTQGALISGVANLIVFGGTSVAALATLMSIVGDPNTIAGPEQTGLATLVGLLVACCPIVVNVALIVWGVTQKRPGQYFIGWGLGLVAAFVIVGCPVTIASGFLLPS